NALGGENGGPIEADDQLLQASLYFRIAGFEGCTQLRKHLTAARFERLARFLADLEVGVAQLLDQLLDRWRWSPRFSRRFLRGTVAGPGEKGDANKHRERGNDAHG